MADYSLLPIELSDLPLDNCYNIANQRDTIANNIATLTKKDMTPYSAYLIQCNLKVFTTHRLFMALCYCSFQLIAPAHYAYVTSGTLVQIVFMSFTKPAC